MVLLCGVDQVEDLFSLFGDSVNLNARWVHSLRQTSIVLEIILEAPDGTPL
jgi:hypothetical protein